MIKTYNRFLKIRGNPKEIALGMALGVFVGMSPFMGLHMAIAIFLAALFKWNKFAAATGVWISNPITAPLLYGITYMVGAKVLGLGAGAGFPHKPNLDTLILLLGRAPEIIWILTVGGIVLGIPLTVIAYYVSLSAINKYREHIRETIAKEKALLAKTRENLTRKIKKKRRRR